MAVKANHKYFSTLVELSAVEDMIKSAKKSLEDGLGIQAACSVREASKHLAEAKYMMTEAMLRSP